MSFEKSSSTSLLSKLLNLNIFIEHTDLDFALCHNYGCCGYRG